MRQGCSDRLARRLVPCAIPLLPKGSRQPRKVLCPTYKPTNGKQWPQGAAAGPAWELLSSRHEQRDPVAYTAPDELHRQHCHVSTGPKLQVKSELPPLCTRSYYSVGVSG